MEKSAELLCHSRWMSASFGSLEKETAARRLRGFPQFGLFDD
jgi:hypothetical protein